VTPYTFHEHTHRFAAWAASTAARASTKCRFTVADGTSILKESNLYKVIDNPDQLPSVKSFDETHKIWRDEIIIIAKKTELNFSHGVAAKLINCYLKAAFANAITTSHEKFKAVHPPVDRILLTALLKDPKLDFSLSFVKPPRLPSWSTFSSDQYEEVISQIKRVLAYDPLNPVNGLWEIEKWWEIK